MEQEPLVISGEEFKSWIEDKITKELVKQVLSIKEDIKDALASGITINRDANGSPPEVSTDRLVGRIEGITSLFMVFSEMKEDTKDRIPYGD